MLVFALAAALCLQVFVLSDKTSRRNEARDRAVLEAQNTAEELKSLRGDLAQAAGLYGGTFDDMPLAEKREDTGIACKYCNYKSVCLNTNKKKVMEKRQFDREEKDG